MRALDQDVHPPVVEALDHALNPGRATDVAQSLIRQPHDPEFAVAFEALADHQLVARLEDVQRHELLWQQHEAEWKQREALQYVGHAPTLRRVPIRSALESVEPYRPQPPMRQLQAELGLKR